MTMLSKARLCCLSAALALATTACGSDDAAANAGETPNSATDIAPDRSGTEPAMANRDPQQNDAQPAAATLVGVADDALPGEEVSADRLYGRWTVERVAAASGASGAPDQSMVGRTMRYDADMLGWLAADGSVESQDRCESPMLSIVHSAGLARRLAQPFRAAWTAMDVPLDRVGPAHQWECDTVDPTSFGPNDGIFFPVGDDRLILNWHKGTILLLRRAAG